MNTCCKDSDRQESIAIFPHKVMDWKSLFRLLVAVYLYIPHIQTYSLSRICESLNDQTDTKFNNINNKCTICAHVLGFLSLSRLSFCLGLVLLFSTYCLKIIVNITHAHGVNKTSSFKLVHSSDPLSLSSFPLEITGPFH